MATPTPVEFPDMNVDLADVVSFADTTLVSFAVIIASALGFAWALRAIKAFVRR